MFLDKGLPFAAGSAVASAILAGAAFLSGTSPFSNRTEINNSGDGATIIAKAPATDQCPSPPRTGGAVFTAKATYAVGPTGQDKEFGTLSCDYGDYNYVLRSDGTEMLSKVTVPVVLWTEKEDVDAALAELR